MSRASAIARLEAASRELAAALVALREAEDEEHPARAPTRRRREYPEPEKITDLQMQRARGVLRRAR